MIERRCDNCDYYRAWRDDKKVLPEGNCRRHPPVVTNEEGVTKWPEVSGYEWCGEFKPKDHGPFYGAR